MDAGEERGGAAVRVSSREINRHARARPSPLHHQPLKRPSSSEPPSAVGSRGEIDAP